MKWTADFFRLLNRCRRVCGGYSMCNSDGTMRMNENGNTVGEVKELNDTIKLEVFRKGVDDNVRMCFKDYLTGMVNSLSRLDGFGALPKGEEKTPRVDAFEKEMHAALHKAMVAYTKGGKIFHRWLTSPDEKVESFLSFDKGVWKMVHLIQNADFDIPEKQKEGLLILLREEHAKANDIENSTTEYWREEERNGRL